MQRALRHLDCDFRVDRSCLAQQLLADTECLVLLLFGLHDKGSLKTGAGFLAMCQAGRDQSARAGLRRNDRRAALAQASYDAVGFSCQAFIYTTLHGHAADYTRTSRSPIKLLSIT